MTLEAIAIGPAIIDLEVLQRERVLALGRVRRATAELEAYHARPSRWLGPPLAALQAELRAAVFRYTDLESYAEDAEREALEVVAATVGGAN